MTSHQSPFTSLVTVLYQGTSLVHQWTVYQYVALGLISMVKRPNDFNVPHFSTQVLQYSPCEVALYSVSCLAQSLLEGLAWGSRLTQSLAVDTFCESWHYQEKQDFVFTWKSSVARDLLHPMSVHSQSDTPFVPTDGPGRNLHSAHPYSFICYKGTCHTSITCWPAVNWAAGG